MKIYLERERLRYERFVLLFERDLRLRLPLDLLRDLLRLRFRGLDELLLRLRLRLFGIRQVLVSLEVSFLLVPFLIFKKFSNHR